MNLTALYRQADYFYTLSEAAISSDVLDRAKNYATKLIKELSSLESYYPDWLRSIQKSSSTGEDLDSTAAVMANGEIIGSLRNILLYWSDILESIKKFAPASVALDKVRDQIFQSQQTLEEQKLSITEIGEVVQQVCNLAKQIKNNLYDLSSVIENIYQEEPDPITSLRELKDLLQISISNIQNILDLIQNQADLTPVESALEGIFQSYEAMYAPTQEEETEMIKEILELEDIDNPEAIQAVRRGNYF